MAIMNASVPNDSNKRSDAAASLRDFFDHQLHHLHELAVGFSKHRQELDQQAEEDREMVENFVDVANAKMRVVHDYGERLRDYVRGLYSHVLAVAEQIPSVVDLNKDAFRANPMVNALFVNTDDIERLFANSPDLRSFLKSYDQQQLSVVYALLTACKSERSTLGIGMMGDLLVRDLPQQTVNFSSHKLHIPCVTSDALAVAVKQYLFERIVMLIKQDIAARIANHTFTPEDNSYQSRLNSLANPSVYLDTLIEYLAVPDNLLRIEKTHIKLNKLGIKITEDDSQHANEFDIFELIWSDQSSHVLLQVAYSL